MPYYNLVKIEENPIASIPLENSYCHRFCQTPVLLGTLVETKSIMTVNVNEDSWFTKSLQRAKSTSQSTECACGEQKPVLSLS
jgi:hypothetical protein